MLQIADLTRCFGTTTALDNISLEVPEGQVACLVGPSGCGKSTLLRLVAGLDVPDRGEIRVGDRILSQARWALEPRRRRLNMVFQDYALWPHMTVAQIVGYGLRHLSRTERDARVSDLLTQMQIGDLTGRLPAQISGGQQQRVAIARALATDPDLLLLDEPLSNLDVQLRLAMRLEFAELFARVGKTVLYVTHDPLEACSFADLLVVMKGGRIVQSGRPEALFARPLSAWIATLAGFETQVSGTLAASPDEGVAEIRISGQGIRLPASVLRGNHTPGRPVTMMVRPSSLSLVERDAPGLTGTVSSALFEGREWRVTLDIGGQALSIMTPVRMRSGETARLHLAQDAAIVFPADEIRQAP